jgi:hypothetical protein
MTIETAEGLAAPSYKPCDETNQTYVRLDTPVILKTLVSSQVSFLMLVFWLNVCERDCVTTLSLILHCVNAIMLCNCSVVFTHHLL